MTDLPKEIASGHQTASVAVDQLSAEIRRALEAAASEILVPDGEEIVISLYAATQVVLAFRAEAETATRVTCPWCQREGRALDPNGRIRFHHGHNGQVPWERCAGSGRRPEEHTLTT
jgi:hypothetical protein